MTEKDADTQHNKNSHNKEKETKITPNSPFIWAIALLVLVIFVGPMLTGNAGNSGATQSNYNQQPQTQPPQNQQPSQTQQPQKICRDVQVPYDYLEQYSETVPYTDRVCESKNLPYSVDQFVMIKNDCTDRDCKDSDKILGLVCPNQFCTDKTVSCSLILKNLDNEQSGVWVTKFVFTTQGTSLTKQIKTEDVSSSLYPQTQETIVGTARIQSFGVDGDANKDITCAYTTTTIPTKQVCRDVTKYKEVTKTRTVTRYRTENKCE